MSICSADCEAFVLQANRPSNVRLTGSKLMDNTNNYYCNYYRSKLMA